LKRKICVLQALFLLLSSGFIAEGRTLDDLFPDTGGAVLKQAREGGYSRSIKTAGVSNPDFTVKPVDEINDARSILQYSPVYVIESLLILKNDKNVTKVDIYNALRKINTLKGRKYFSATRGKPAVLFEDASRIAGEKDTKKRNDPPHAAVAPFEQTIFIMVKDTNFGNCYYRAEIDMGGNGVKYSLANFRSINYLLIPVIKPEKLQIHLYLESLDEGVLIYGLTGVATADFAENHADIPSLITKRLDVIYDWIGDNIKNP
jgi:hypothetical protein